MYNVSLIWVEAQFVSMAQVHNKLVRDKIPDVIRAKGQVPVMRRIEGAEYRVALQKKLREEVDEVMVAATPEEILAELADCLEVIEALSKDLNYTMDQLHLQKALKKQDRGGFDQKIFLERVD